MMYHGWYYGAGSVSQIRHGAPLLAKNGHIVVGPNGGNDNSIMDIAPVGGDIDLPINVLTSRWLNHG
jgi:hypothetical protein